MVGYVRLRRCNLIARAATAFVVLGACSSQPLPSALGNCVVVGDSSCASAHLGGGAVGSAGNSDGSVDDVDNGASGCSAGPSASQCQACVSANCCAYLNACTASTECSNLLSCVLACAGAGVSACIDGCNGRYQGSVTALNDVESCLTLKCPICSESGIGDPCAPGVDACISGLTCNDFWCTSPDRCTKGSDCLGIGPNGGNDLGFANECIAIGSGNFCTPSCVIDTESSGCVSGTFCHTTTSVDGLTVSVCATLPDGG
jgi:hypothetical protein